LTLDALLRESVRRHGDRAALVFGGEPLRYDELDGAVGALAARLGEAAGEVEGRAVALVAPNTPALVVGLFAIWRLGAVAVPLSARLREHELGQILADAEPAALVSVEAHLGYSFRELLPRLRPEAPCLFVDASGACVDSTQGLHGTAPPLADGTAAVLYTSGTSGAPKRVLVSHRRELDGAAHLAQILDLAPDDAAVFVIPLAHAFGFTCLLACVKAGAAAVLVESSASLGPLLAAAETTHATVLHGSPRLFSSLLDARSHGLPSVRTGFVAGSASPAGLLERLEDAGMRILNLYGLTELGAVAACRSDDPPDIRYTTAGRPLPGHELRTVDGELQVLSPYEEDWFRTGDLAELEDGCVRITGRISELVNVGGFNVSPAEVEAVLAGHDSVAAAVVVGVGGDATGQALHAFVVARPGAEVDRAGLLRFARARIAGYKLPYVIHVVPELPLLPSGKPDRRALKAA
jgi:long-chain acyl-CoA synthetase